MRGAKGRRQNLKSLVVVLLAEMSLDVDQVSYVAGTTSGHCRNGTRTVQLEANLDL